MKRKLASLPLLALLASPGIAQAKTICVADPTCTGAQATSVAHALETARQPAFAGADRVQIGPGKFAIEGSASYDGVTGEDLEVAGAGDSTVLTYGSPDKDDFWTGLDIKAGGANVSVHDLAIAMPAGNQVYSTGVHFAGVDAHHLSITGPGRIGAELQYGSFLRDSRMEMGNESTAVAIGPGGATVQDSAIASGTGVWATAAASVRRVRIVASSTGVAAKAAWVRVSDSVIRTTGLNVPALLAGGEEDTTTLLQASRVTTYNPGVLGAAVRAIGLAKGTQVKVAIDHSIIAGSKTAFETLGPRGSVEAHDVAVPAGAKGTTTGDGVSVQGATTAEPKFVDAAGGDYRLAPSSPLIDQPATSSFVAPGPFDIVRAPRVADGNGDGIAAPDLGAYELQPVPPNADADHPTGTALPQAGPGATGSSGLTQPPRDTTAPRLSGLRVVKHGLRLRLSESARVTVSVSRRRGRTWKSVRTVTRPLGAGARTIALPGLRAGRYRLTVVAIDAAGNRSPAGKVTTTIRRP